MRVKTVWLARYISRGLRLTVIALHSMISEKLNPHFRYRILNSTCTGSKGADFTSIIGICPFFY
jgi:hypothetical protein